MRDGGREPSSGQRLVKAATLGGGLLEDESPGPPLAHQRFLSLREGERKVMKTRAEGRAFPRAEGKRDSLRCLACFQAGRSANRRRKRV